MRHFAQGLAASGDRLARVVITADGKQRIRLSRSLTSMFVYVVSILTIEYSIRSGIIRDPYWVRWLQVGMILWMAGVYAVLRSGLNERLTDRGLTNLQILGANTWITLGYALCPAIRGGMMMLLTLVLVFGIFDLSRRGRAIVNTWTLSFFGAVQWYMSQKYPAEYPPRIELVHWCMVATVVPVVSLLGGQLNDMRVKLKQQKADLVEALDRIREMAQHDELTGLYNRRHMNQLIEDAVRNMERSGLHFCVCIIDIDFFKKVNDTYGHGVGDDVLRNFARQAGTIFRDTDSIARWGGEEFLLLMGNTRAEHASIAVQRLHAAIGGMVIATAPSLRVTFSAGVAQFRQRENTTAVIERADQALYKAKETGRNQTMY
ncbi:MAG TPA: GGDEF domain-containing protein [Oxalobacteraceae bacterium]|nr:GGDEF domain-containing protein [Oxalobacteraceae bacterium]